MNNMTEVIKHLRAVGPHMKAMGDALDRYSVQDRMDELVDIANFIGNASLLECKHIINELIDRTSTITGCATELENAACALSRSIEIDGDIDGDASDCLRAHMDRKDEA